MTRKSIILCIAVFLAGIFCSIIFSNAFIAFIGFLVAATYLLLDFVRWLNKNQSQKPTITEEDIVIDELIENNMVIIDCPCGESQIPGVAYANAENIFTCTKCNSKLRVELYPSVTLVTEPQNIEKMFDLLKSKIDLVERNSSKIEENER